MQDRGRAIDKTHLSCEQAEESGGLHRDYIAHCLRWAHVVKHLGIRNRYKTAQILDIGCGKETPLIKTLYTMRMTPEVYVGVDYNKQPPRPSENPIHKKIYDKMGGGNFDLIWNWDASTKNSFKNLGFTPSLITCFEVLEHVTPEKVLGIIENIKSVSDGDTDIFISTPCFNGKAAANHINEMTYDFMRDLMQKHFKVEAHWGTFASQKDIEPVIYGEHSITNDFAIAYEYLKSYYDSNLLSVIFAPLYPRYSRNCIWHLKMI